MAAPAVQTRTQPVAGSYKMHDGFPTTIAFQNVPNIAFWEEAVTPPGVNRNQAITVRFPTSDSITFFGFLQKFEPAEQKEGEAPHATVTIVPTNWDPVNNVEAGPVYTAAAGT
jgi:hypothetical protein